MARNGKDQDAFISLRRLKDFWTKLKVWLSSNYVSKEQYREPFRVAVRPTWSNGVITGFSIIESTGRTPVLGDEVIVTLDTSTIDGYELVAVGEKDIYDYAGSDPYIKGPWKLTMENDQYVDGADSYLCALNSYFDNNGSPQASGPMFKHYYTDEQTWVSDGYVSYDLNEGKWDLWYN